MSSVEALPKKKRKSLINEISSSLTPKSSAKKSRMSEPALDEMSHSLVDNEQQQSPERSPFSGDLHMAEHSKKAKVKKVDSLWDYKTEIIDPKPKLSIALPGSILENVHTLLSKTSLASQVARACAIFQVNEVVIFDDLDDAGVRNRDTRKSCDLLKKLLEYTNCPQYLRKALFVVDEDLAYASLLHPLATPAHMKSNDKSRYREGITLAKKTPQGMTMANCGLAHDVILDRKLKPNICITAEIDKNFEYTNTARVVSPEAPFSVGGIYWGYKVRVVDSIRDIFSKDDHSKYDLIIGTSDKGESITKVELPSYENLLVVFGGVNGIEIATRNVDVNDSECRKMFHFYLNCCPSQGSRTIRTEEAIPIVLTALKYKFSTL